MSSSGATAVFLLEAGMQMGLKFAGVYSVGNGAQVDVEDVLEHLDRTFDPVKDSRIKLLYLESVSDPARLLRHAASLVKKGARIAAIRDALDRAAVLGELRGTIRPAPLARAVATAICGVGLLHFEPLLDQSQLERFGVERSDFRNPPSELGRERRELIEPPSAMFMISSIS